jgi:hypothetical protein
MREEIEKLQIMQITYTNIPPMFFFFLVAPTLGSLLPLLEHRAEFPQFLDQRESVGLLGRVISPSQGLYLYINTEKRTHTHTLNIHALYGIRTHGTTSERAKTVHALDSSATVTGSDVLR